MDHATGGKTNVSLISATLLSATCMIGSGWLFSAQLTAQYAGNWAFLAWLLAASLVWIVGLCLARVVAIYPVRGALVQASALSHNRIFGMPFAFANWFGTLMVVATEAQATTQYLSSAIDSAFLIENHVLTPWGKALALGILAVYLLINFYGISLLAKVNNIITVLKIFTPLFALTVLLIVVFSSDTTSSNFSLVSNQEFGFGNAFSAIIGAGLIYSFNGFQISVAFASEIKNPERNIPLAITLSIAIITLVYLALQYAFMASVPNDLLVANGGWQGLDFDSPLLDLATLLGLHFLAMVLLADSVTSPSAAGYTYLGASSRVLFAMASVGQMPRWLAVLDPVHNISRRSMLTNWLLAAIVLVNAESWAELMVIVTGYHVIGYMAAPISMGALEPQTRWFGGGVFALLGLILLTIPPSSLFLVSISLTVLICLYGFLQIADTGAPKLVAFALPFLAYLWFLYFVQIIWVVVIVSVVFYLLVSTQLYVKFCKTYRKYIGEY
ncbi:APC family permease [Microbulbifer sp. OS29]|uniref:APC family permease n=1 Tax=Microbulbifer okhotskensis TaxID=2926617 RepID=A0A9X2J6E7_9GAMM|nr:APC family permease [Microbulbifer okhotskensis]MCO1336552.1 APC family permease [Microbulbifer okhotskensis]